MKIRRECPEDYQAILRLTYQAFQLLDFPGRRRMDEHFLISLLRDSDAVIPELRFVAEYDGEIVGHIIYSKSEIRCADGTCKPTLTFGPLSVLPSYHRQGVGTVLVKHSLEQARELGCGAVLIVGVPDYYPKLGFTRAREYGLMLPDGTAPDAFMAYELIPRFLNGGGEFHLLGSAFEEAETDESGYEIFHQAFMREHYPSQLILRPLWEADVALFEKWLHMPHVAKWFEQPAEWMHEIRNRWDEFNFIQHFIAEIDGVAIGWCQLYDCYDGQRYEDWYTVERLGEQFSVDYLIGEPTYLRKGYGGEMIKLLEERIASLGAKRILVHASRENIASRKVLEDSGYDDNGKYYTKEIWFHRVS